MGVDIFLLSIGWTNRFTSDSRPMGKSHVGNLSHILAIHILKENIYIATDIQIYTCAETQKYTHAHRHIYISAENTLSSINECK